MSVYVAYKAESVGPVVKKLVKEQDGLIAIHEDQIDFTKLQTAKVVQQPPPPDPLLAVWRQAGDAAHEFANLNPTRGPIVGQAIDHLVGLLTQTKQAAATPAPAAPPPVKTEPSVLVRWGSRREGNADIVINSAAAVTLARDKKGTRQVITGLCPTTWYRQSEVRTPCVIRPRRHHAGKKFYVCNTAAEVTSAINKCGPGWYATQLIDKAAEYRVFILQDRVIRVSTKTAPDDGGIAWNVGVGATATGLARKNWPINVVKAALAAARKLNLDWTAIDVCTDKQGNALVLEANTAPGLATGSRAIEQIAWAFAWVANNAKPTALDLPNVTTWQQVLHPSLAEATEA